MVLSWMVGWEQDLFIQNNLLSGFFFPEGRLRLRESREDSLGHTAEKGQGQTLVIPSPETEKPKLRPGPGDVAQLVTCMSLGSTRSTV